MKTEHYQCEKCGTHIQDTDASRIPPPMEQAVEYLASGTDFDGALESVSGMTWLPWVGSRYGIRSCNERLLVVGESHYTRPSSPDQLAKIIQDHIDYRPYTRDVVSECLVHQDWRNRTLDTLPKLLFGTSSIDRVKLWSDTAYYNFVQRLMHYNRKGQPERPTWDDFVLGWQVFSDIVRILRPSHCVFIGVAAANSFDYALKTLGHSHTPVQRTEYISRTQGRRASITIDGHMTEIAFVQHLGKFFSWSQWHRYLRSHHRELTAWLDAQRYTTH